MQELIERKKEPDLDLNIVNPETKTVTIPFKKKSETDCSTIKLVFYNKKTKKNEDTLFYNYYEHLKKFGFEWENTAIDFKFLLNLSNDEKRLIKKMTMGREIRLKLHTDESRIWNIGIRNVKKHSYMSEKDLSTRTIF